MVSYVSPVDLVQTDLVDRVQFATVQVVGG